MLLSENTNFDFGSKPLDEPFTDAELARFTGTQSGRDRVVAALGDRKPTPRDFITITRRGKLPPPWVGGPKEVADTFEEWFSAPACDGFVVGAACVPGSYEDFVALRRPRAAAPRAVPQGLQGRDAAGEPRPAAAVRQQDAIAIEIVGMGRSRLWWEDAVVAQSRNEAWLGKVKEEALEPELPICDPHHHLWDFRKGARAGALSAG